VLLLVCRAEESAAIVPAHLAALPNVTVAYLPRNDREQLLRVLNDFAGKYYPGRDALAAQK
jgi:hypothetical protein